MPINTRVKTRRSGSRARQVAGKRSLFHCQACESVVRYHDFVMRYNPSTDQILTPSGLVINIKRKSEVK